MPVRETLTSWIDNVTARVTAPVAAASVCGQVHASNGVGSQDSFGVNVKLSNSVLAACVCDGHGPRGEEAAHIAATHLMLEVERQIGEHAAGGDAVRSAIKAAEAAVAERSFARCSGATVAVALVIGNEIYVGNVGDCEAVLVSQNLLEGTKSEVVTVKHNADDPRERKRVERAGGTVQGGMVKVQSSRGHKIASNISRSLGDLDLKEFGVSAEPHVVAKQIPKDDAMLILGTDGLWGNGDGEGDLSLHEYYAEEAAKHAKVPYKALKGLFNIVGQREDDTTIVVMKLESSREDKAV